MQILASGSFVILENRKKIEQVIFTAKELAKELATEGFVGTTEGNRRPAREMWKGVEYMSRAHEGRQSRTCLFAHFLLFNINVEDAVKPAANL